MSVTTTANELYDQAKDKVKEIQVQLKELSDLLDKMLDSDTWGSNDWSDSMQTEITNLMQFAIETKIKMRLQKHFN